MCGSPLDIQAHHLRHAARLGFGRKNSDRWAVPLCVRCHLDCHTRGDEADWWKGFGIDPIDWSQQYFRRQHGTDSL